MSLPVPAFLGFLEEPIKPWLLSNRFFPSKVGGKPAWLDLEHLPTPEQLQCPTCKDPRIFLCQIYAPVESFDWCFHRTIFVFICKNEKCCLPNKSSNIIAFRNQLPRENKYYSSTEPDESKDHPAILCLVPLCDVCGCMGPLKCGQCKKANYCGKNHQRVDWKRGHKKSCTEGSQDEKLPVDDYLYPEWELSMDEEDLESLENSLELDPDAEKKALDEYNEMVKSGNAGKMADVPESEILPYANVEEDKVFAAFKKRVANDHDQVIRYDKAPLWISGENQIQLEDVPDCEACGSKRKFEFQIMPQLLHGMKLDQLDWGVVCIYTCMRNCNNSYSIEFVHKQDIVESVETNKDASEN